MRFPAVCGTCYPSDKNELKAQIDKLLADAASDPVVSLVKNPEAFIVPHSSLGECGDVMASAYATLHDIQSFTTFVILGTDHFGKGTAVALSRDDWRTPFGVVKNDLELGNMIKRESSFADFDEKAHSFESAVEIQLPFLQSVIGQFSCVEISIASHSFDIAKDIAIAIDTAAVTIGRNVIVIGSTDFSRDETPESAENEDSTIIQLIQELRTEDIMNQIEGIGSSICGPAVLGATVLYADRVGLNPTLLKRTVLPDGKKGQVKSFVSFAFSKTRRD